MRRHRRSARFERKPPDLFARYRRAVQQHPFLAPDNVVVLVEVQLFAEQIRSVPPLRHGYAREELLQITVCAEQTQQMYILSRLHLDGGHDRHPELLSRTQRERDVPYRVVVGYRHEIQPRQSSLSHHGDRRHLLLRTGGQSGMDVKIVAVFHTLFCNNRLSCKRIAEINLRLCTPRRCGMRLIALYIPTPALPPRRREDP